MNYWTVNLSGWAYVCAETEDEAKLAALTQALWEDGELEAVSAKLDDTLLGGTDLG